VSLLEADLLDGGGMRSLLASVSPGACIHCAWYVDARDYVTSVENFRFVGASIDLALGLAAAGCGRFVGVGSCLEYSAAGGGPLREDGATSNESAYAASKLSVGSVLPQIGDATGMSTAWSRLFFLYGPHEKPSRLVPSVILSLLHGATARLTAGDQVRDFLHLEDVAAGLVAILDSELSGAVNVGSGVPVTVKHVAGTVASVLGVPDLVEQTLAPPGSAASPDELWADSSLLRSTGWAPRLSLLEGIADTVEWWRHRLF
jgi:nucleoside-diphosphate-sugar epimerase